MGTREGLAAVAAAFERLELDAVESYLWDHGVDSLAELHAPADAEAAEDAQRARLTRE